MERLYAFGIIFLTVPHLLGKLINHLIGQENPQKLEPTNGIIRQETGDKRLSKSGSLHRAIGT